jgi:hypothetical protein
VSIPDYPNFERSGSSFEYAETGRLPMYSVFVGKNNLNGPILAMICSLQVNILLHCEKMNE